MKYLIQLFIFIILVFISFYIFILSVDPYDKYNFNYWELKTKAVNSYRDNKFNQIDNSQIKYDLFIIGSSRVQGFNPSLIELETGLKTFNYGVNNSKPEDLLAITRHIIAKQKPKIIFLQVDFYHLNKSIPIDRRLKTSPLGKYLNENIKASSSNSIFYLYNQSYLTLRSLRDSIKIIYKNKLGKIETTHNKNGMKIEHKIPKKAKLAKAYFQNEYKNYEFGKQRIQDFIQLKELCKKNDINLIVSISPMNKEHFLTLMKNKKLFNMLLMFKRKIVEIFIEVYDFNNLGAFQYNYPYWIDSVHPSMELSNIMSEIIFDRKKEESNIFGKKITNDNINQYLQDLNISSQKLFSN